MDETELNALRDLLTIQAKKIEALENKISIVAEFLSRELEAISQIEAK